eukprot:COSAG01_NODE_13630_length_1556_cov_13.477694_1_plen_128_part_10
MLPLTQVSKHSNHPHTPTHTHTHPHTPTHTPPAHTLSWRAQWARGVWIRSATPYSLTQLLCSVTGAQPLTRSAHTACRSVALIRSPRGFLCTSSSCAAGTEDLFNDIRWCVVKELALIDQLLPGAVGA